MPIVGSKENVHVEYAIPEDIRSRIPDYFYYAMAGELVSIFGPQILQKKIGPEEYDGSGKEIGSLTSEDRSYYDLDSSTGGWVEAFKTTCRKLHMMWLVDYWKTLEWYDSDIFDGEIEGEIIKRFCEKDHSQDHANCYYRYLCSVSEKE